MSEIDKLIDKLAIEAARNVLSNEAESPGSQDSANIEAARQILGRLLDAATGLPECHQREPKPESLLTAG
jgi:hypothetical protein